MALPKSDATKELEKVLQLIDIEILRSRLAKAKARKVVVGSYMVVAGMLPPRDALKHQS
jgi:hypothetical protein